MATIKENFFKNRGLGINPLNEMDNGIIDYSARGGYDASDEKSDRKMMKMYFKQNPKAYAEYVELSKQEEKLNTMLLAIHDKKIEIEHAAKGI